MIHYAIGWNKNRTCVMNIEKREKTAENTSLLQNSNIIFHSHQRNVEFFTFGME